MKRFLRNTTTGIWSKPGAEVKGMAFTASRTSVNDTSTKSRSPGGRCVPHAKSIAAWRLSLEGGRDGKKTGANAAALPSSVETTSSSIDKESTSPWARGWDSLRYKDQRSVRVDSVQSQRHESRLAVATSRRKVLRASKKCSRLYTRLVRTQRRCQ